MNAIDHHEKPPNLCIANVKDKAALESLKKHFELEAMGLDFIPCWVTDALSITWLEILDRIMKAFGVLHLLSHIYKSEEFKTTAGEIASDMRPGVWFFRYIELDRRDTSHFRLVTGVNIKYGDGDRFHKLVIDTYKSLK